ncbi:MAG: asparagine synthase (glutamine-hydrolyzing) [bacterium]
MCGICGFTKSDPDPDKSKEIISTMCDTMISRGPDDSGYYQDTDIALGMRRLSIIDLATGHQPIPNEDKTIWLICNGEIYNFKELKNNLIAQGHQFQTKSDSEVIIHLYEEEGVECVHKLNGMFGLALWDCREKKLFIARDRLGIKPLHFIQCSDGSFVFASEIKALLKYPGWERTINPIALNYYLTYETVPAPYTIFTHVFKLSPGHLLVFQNNKITISQYWDLNYLKDCNNAINEADAKEHFLHLFSQSVKYRMISDVPLGTFLSGGIDSSMIAAYAQHHRHTSIDSFNIGFHEKSFDESGYARDVASYLNQANNARINHHEDIFSINQLLAVLPTIVEFMDEPFADPSLLPTYLLCKFARQHVTVALSGDGGDELFAGYPTYQAHAVSRFYLKLPGGLRRGIIEPLIRQLPVSDKNFSLDFIAKRFISHIDSPAHERHAIWMGAFSPEQKDALYGPDVKSTMSKLDTFFPIKKYLSKAKVTDPLDAILYLDMKIYLQDDLLVKVDRTSMATSLEVRVPFLDHNLVDFVTRLPSNLKLKRLKSKYLLKQSARDFLPHHIINRKKKGFGIPIAQWIKLELHDLFHDMLSADRIKREGLFNPTFVSSLLDDHITCRSNNRKALWTLFMFEQWVNTYLEGKPVLDDKSV